MESDWTSLQKDSKVVFRDCKRFQSLTFMATLGCIETTSFVEYFWKWKKIVMIVQADYWIPVTTHLGGR